MSLTIAEIVGKLKRAKTKNERVQILKDNDCAALRGIIRMNFDESLALSLPKGRPPFKSTTVPDGFAKTTLKASAKGWYVFVKELSPNVKQSNREAMFIQLLESLDKSEAEILLSAKDGELDLGLTKKAINEVFPGLIKSEGSKDGGKKESAKTDSASSTSSLS
jgi:Family of unknown function (DUF6433)